MKSYLAKSQFIRSSSYSLNDHFSVKNSVIYFARKDSTVLGIGRSTAPDAPKWWVLNDSIEFCCSLNGSALTYCLKIIEMICQDDLMCEMLLLNVFFFLNCAKAASRHSQDVCFPEVPCRSSCPNCSSKFIMYSFYKSSNRFREPSTSL